MGGNMQNKFYFMALGIVFIGFGAFICFRAITSRRIKHFSLGALLALVGTIMLALTYYLGDLGELLNSISGQK